jgi:hypothetical protein
MTDILYCIGLSTNQPKFSSCATWTPHGITFANISTVGIQPNTIFVTLNNAIYVAETNLNQVQMWAEINMTPITTISAGLIQPHGIFISNVGDVYIDNGFRNNQVDKWTWNATSSVPVMNVSGSCCCLFIVPCAEIIK